MFGLVGVEVALCLEGEGHGVLAFVLFGHGVVVEGVGGGVLVVVEWVFFSGRRGLCGLFVVRRSKKFVGSGWKG